MKTVRYEVFFDHILMTKTTQKCANVLDVNVVLHFLILFFSSFRFVQPNY